MNAEELQALRHYLFFTPPEAAALIGGVSERAWRYWEAGGRPIPADVAEAIENLIEWRATVVDTIAELIDEDDDEAGGIVIVWYESMDDWASLAGREPMLWRPHQSACAEARALFGDRIRLVKFDLPEYAKWLGGRADTETTRAEWSAGIS